MKAQKVITPQKRARFCISVVLFAGVLMLGLNLLLSTVGVLPLMFLTDGDLAQNELLWMLFEMTVYFLVIALTGTFLLIVFRKSPLSAFRGPLSTTKFPFLFIPAAMGLFYLLNLVIGIVFEKPLEPFNLPTDEASYPGTTLGVALYCLLISIMPAILEEWLFRGIMQKNLAPAIGRTPAIVISALVFGLMHSHPSQSVFAFVFGLVAGYAFDKTGSIWFGALIHMFNNAVSFVATYWYDVYHVEMADTIFGIFVLCMIGIFVISIPIYIVTAIHTKKKFARKTDAERLIPTAGKITKMTLCNPFLYVLIAGYCGLLWLLYFVVV